MDHAHISESLLTEEWTCKQQTFVSASHTKDRVNNITQYTICNSNTCRLLNLYVASLQMAFQRKTKLIM
jgi:hypothetical protein